MDISKKQILITGCAGFIGAALCKFLLKHYPEMVIIGVDNMNEYYDVKIKEERLRPLQSNPHFIMHYGDITKKEEVETFFNKDRPEIVVNLAAQAGVRYSIDNPQCYIESNIVGFFNILEACRNNNIEHLVYASSSSVYGNNKKNFPFGETSRTDSPISLYAATKKTNEVLAFAYSNLYGIPVTGLRFFTVYGPLGRPDMAYFKFAETYSRGGTIRLYNNAEGKRDYTYIDDLICGIHRVLQKSSETQSGNEKCKKFEIYNIGSSQPIELKEFVSTLERLLKENGVVPPSFNFDIHKQYVPKQKGDAENTYADMALFNNQFGELQHTPLEDGLREFVRWFKRYKNRNG